MPAPTKPDEPIEREYRSLTRKLDAARGFCFVVYFVDDGGIARRLRDRLAADLVTRDRRIVVLAADAPEALAGYTLTGVFEAARHGGRPVVWVEAFRDDGDTAWDAGRRSLLMRMNERRSRFEAELRAPLVLLLPGAAQREAASLAPDLWHVRLHSAPLASTEPATGLLGASIEGRASASVSVSVSVSASASASLADDVVPPAVAYWNAIEAGAEVGQPLFDGFKAVQAWLSAGQPARAAALAERLVARARARVDARLPDDANPALVELAIALRDHGGARLQLGEVEAAIDALQESARLLDGAGSDPAFAGLLSTVQKRLGDALLDAGRPREAEARFRDGLSTLARVGAAPDAREAQVAAALRVRVGDAATAAGDAVAAFEAYRQSVDDWRRLAAASGDDPSLRRSLATALGRLGTAEAQLGRGERALRSYAEATALLRPVVARADGEASAARELAKLQMRTSIVQQAAGRYADAFDGYAAALDVARTMSERGQDASGVLATLEAELDRLDPVHAQAAGALLASVRAARK